MCYYTLKRQDCDTYDAPYKKTKISHTTCNDKGREETYGDQDD